MAGHRRRQRGEPKLTRTARRRAYWRGQIQTARTSEELYDRAADYLRAVASGLPDTARTSLLNTMAAELATRADTVAREAA